MVSIELVAFAIGVIYGFVNPGKEDRLNILKKALIIGIVVGLLIGLVVAFFVPVVGILVAGVGALSFALVALYFTIFFVIGTFIGDALERIRK
ncbi:MAG: hypothetical protein H0Z28_07925 [Archaeoglobus sp.]|nr:hypothetical protein [Archaeoglobus sp.]